MTNEKGLFAQAGLRNVRGSTIERKIMSTKTSFKRVSAVAALALAIGGFTAVSANATVNAVDTVITDLVTSASTTADVAHAGAIGVAVTANLIDTLSHAAQVGDIIATTFVVKDPNGVTVPATVTAAAGPVGTNGVVTGGTTGTITVTTGVGGMSAAALTIGTVSFTPTIGGTYTLTSTTVFTAGAAGDTNAGKAELGQTSNTDGAFVVSGMNVSQGTTLGSAGAAALANQAQVKVIYPAAGGTFKVTSSGVGSIGGALSGGVGAANTNVSGVTTDFSQGVTTIVTAAANTATNLFTLLNPANAGVQTITLSSVAAGTGISTTVGSVTITWGALTNFSAGVSTAFMAGPGVAAHFTTPNLVSDVFTSTTDAVAETAAKGTGTATNKIAQVEVILKNADGTVSNGNTVTASITGSGLVSVDTTAATANGTARSATSGVLTGANVAYVHINTDGTAGSGTVTISVTNTAGVTVTLATKTVTSYGAVSKLAVAATNFTIGKAGFTTGGALTNRHAGTEIGGTGNTSTVTSGTTSTPAFIIKSTDSAGNVANPASAPSVKSSDTTVISGGTCILDDGLDTTFSSGGTGFFNCNFSAASGAASGAKATLTIRITDPADSTGLTFITTTVPVTVGGSVAKEVISTDKASYAPGEALNITVTATDSSGNPVFDGAPAVGAITSSKSLGGTAFAPAIYVGGKASSKSSTGVVSTFAPSVQGAFSLNATGTDAATKPLTASATVTDGSTTSAQIASLITKINALAALIAKIQKKLGVK